MSNEEDLLALTVPVPAAEWDFINRRLQYLEASIHQLLPVQGRLQEWFSAGELAALQLPFMPGTRQGITRLARSTAWRCRVACRDGRSTWEYHVCSIPGRSFAALLLRIDQATATRLEPAATPLLREAVTPETPAAAAAVPQWVLPLLRVIRGRPGCSIGAILAELPSQLPKGVECPTEAEAESVLHRLGVAVKGI